MSGNDVKILRLNFPGLKHRSSIKLGSDLHAEIDGSGGVGERADGDVVDSGEGIFADVFEDYPAGGFDGNGKAAVADDADGLFDVGRGHVIEEYGFGSALEGELQFLKGANFNFNGAAGFAVCQRGGEHLLQAS